MAEEGKTKLRLEIAHVLFLDIAGYSKLLIDKESEALHELNQIVRQAEAVREAQAAIEIFARVAAQTGEPERGNAALEKILSSPYAGILDVPLTPALLRLDPMSDPLRNDPRFQKLCEGKQR